METVLFVFPTLWDRKQLDACRPRWEGRFVPRFAGPEDVDCPWNFDVFGFLDEAAASPLPAGVISTSDYPGAAVAAALASRAGLPGPDPAAVLEAGNKLCARRRLARALPGSSPPFAPIDPDAPLPSALPRYPCYVKPVKGSFSTLCRRMTSEEELAGFLGLPVVSEFRRQYLSIFDRLASAYAPEAVSRGAFLAEGALPGVQVTVEGYAFRGEITIMGVVDSVLQPGTGSFLRFEFPSRLPGPVQDRLEREAAAAIRALDLDRLGFNVEMAYDPAGDRIGIIEVNARFCGQFADLHQRVDGINTYELALPLATGRPPAFTRGGGAWPAAVSLPLRVFEPCRVERAPSPERLAEVEREIPGTLVWSECREGEILDDFESLEDGWSFRYGVVNAGGANAEDARLRAEEAARRLGFSFAAIRSAPGPVSAA